MSNITPHKQYEPKEEWFWKEWQRNKKKSKMTEEQILKEQRDMDRDTITTILESDPELLQEVIQKLRKYKLDKLK